MADCSEVFVGLDTSKLRNAVAIAEGGRNGEVRYLGEIENAEAAIRKLVKKLAASHRRLTFCYEAGPTGYGLYRQIKALGHERVVVAPSLMAVRGLDLISAVIFMAEIGDLSRFATPRQLMADLGLVPGEESTGDRVWRGGITKAGNHRARRILVECSWSYRHPPRVGKKKLAKVEAAPPAVQEIAWKAQARLTARYRALSRRGKRPTLVVTAIARELSGFIWAVSQAVGAPATAAM
jgi:transposase